MLLRRPESNAKIRWRQQLVFQMNWVEIFGVKLGGEPFQAVMSHADEIVPDCERTAWLLSIPVQSSFSTEFLAKWPGDRLIESLWALLGIRLYFKWNYITNRLVHSACCFRKQVSVTSEEGIGSPSVPSAKFWVTPTHRKYIVAWRQMLGKYDAGHSYSCCAWITQQHWMQVVIWTFFRKMKVLQSFKTSVWPM